MNNHARVQMLEINDSKNIKWGVVLSYIGMAVSMIGALFVSNRVLKYIGDYNYGLFSFVNSITTWLSIVSTALTASFLRYTTLEANENKGNVGKTNTLYFKMLMIIGLIVSIVGLLVIGYFYTKKITIGKYNWEDSSMMYLLFALSIFNIGLTMPTSIFSLYITYKKKFVFSKLISIIISICNFGGQFLVAYYCKSVIALACFSIVITLLTYCFNSYYCHKKLNIEFSKVSLRDNKKLIYSISVFSGILLFNTVVDQINSNVDKTLLGIFSVPENVTIYQMAQQLVSCFTVMSVSVSGVFAPTIHELVIKNEKQSIDKLYIKVSKIQTIILCCVAFGFLACGKDFIIWWIGEKRVASYYVASTLMIISLGPLTLNSSIEIQRAENKHLFRAIVYFVLAITNVVLSIFCISLYGKEYAIYACLTGTAITTICSHWVAMNIYNKKVIGLPIGKYILCLFQYIALGIGCYCIVRLFDTIIPYNINNAFFKFIIRGCVFVFPFCIVSCIFNKREVIVLLKKLNRNG